VKQPGRKTFSRRYSSPWTTCPAAIVSTTEVSPISRRSTSKMSWSKTARSALAPSTSEPRCPSSWFTYATPRVKASTASSTVTASEDRNQALGQCAVHRHVDLLERIGTRDRPIAAEGDLGSAGEERGDAVLPIRTFGTDQGDRELLHLGIAARPQRLKVRNCAQRSEPLEVVWRNELQVGDVVSAQPASRSRQRLECVEGEGYRPVANGVEVHLEALDVKGRDRRRDEVRLEEQVAAMAGAGRRQTQVGLAHRGRRRLADPIEHHLHGRRSERADARSLASREQLGDLLEPAVAVPPQRADDACAEPSVPRPPSESFGSSAGRQTILDYNGPRSPRGVMVVRG
jgi:hypothetical protein